MASKKYEVTAKRAAVVKQIKKGSSFHVASAEGKSVSRSSREAAATAMRAKGSRVVARGWSGL